MEQITTKSIDQRKIRGSNILFHEKGEYQAGDFNYLFHYIGGFSDERNGVVDDSFNPIIDSGGVFLGEGVGVYRKGNESLFFVNQSKLIVAFQPYTGYRNAHLLISLLEVDDRWEIKLTPLNTVEEPIEYDEKKITICSFYTDNYGRAVSLKDQRNIIKRWKDSVRGIPITHKYAKNQWDWWKGDGYEKLHPIASGTKHIVSGVTLNIAKNDIQSIKVATENVPGMETHLMWVTFGGVPFRVRWNASFPTYRLNVESGEWVFIGDWAMWQHRDFQEWDLTGDGGEMALYPLQNINGGIVPNFEIDKPTNFFLNPTILYITMMLHVEWVNNGTVTLLTRGIGSSGHNFNYQYVTKQERS